MNEGPTQNPLENKKFAIEEMRWKMSALAIELSQSTESFPFTGMDNESYQERKTIEVEYPGCATPIDELLERFKKEGMKVMLGKDPANSFVLPSNSNDLVNDSVLTRHLQINEA